MTEKGAIFSECRKYRYSLWRTWDLSKPRVAFIGLNPSTADENVDDPTIRRCIAFAKDWGYGGIWMLNLFAFRATDPREMKLAPDPIGATNDINLISIASSCPLTIAAWGNHGRHLNRARKVSAHLFPKYGIDLSCLGVTKYGEPKHPLYLKADLKPVKFGGSPA